MTLLEALLPHLHCEPVDRALERSLRGLNTVIPGDGDSLPAILAAMIQQEAKIRDIERIIVVAANRSDAEALHDDLTNLEPGKVFICPQREAFPGDKVGAPPAEQSERALALEALTTISDEPITIVLPAVVLLEGIANPKPSLQFAVGDLLDPEELSQLLIEAGFDREAMVSEPEEFARRGGIFDLFGWGEEKFLRIELDDIEIVSLRLVDPATQRSVVSVEKASIRVQSPIAASGNFLLQNLNPAKTRFVFSDATGVAFAWQDWHRAVEERPDIEHPPYLSDSDAAKLLQPFSKLLFTSFKQPSSALLEEVPVDETVAVSESGVPKPPKRKPIKLVPADAVTIELTRHALQEFRGDLDAFEGGFRRLEGQHWKSFLLCDSDRQRERLFDLFDAHEDSRLTELPILVPSLHRGFSLTDAKLVLFTEHQLFGRTRRRGRHRRFIATPMAKSQLDGLRRGDYVVHVDHGIGRFDGIERITVAESTQDCFKILFHGGVSVYVRMEHFHKLQPYRAEESEPQLSRIGGGEWMSARTRAKKAATDMAKHILELYATRAIIEREPATGDGVAQHEFEAAFEYEETPDQLSATEEIKQDLESPRPMDRLLIGDVGFGKTEVAMRAAWKVLQENRQVAVVCPTTVLAAQHGETFRERFRYTGANIEVISRFVLPKEVKRILTEAKQGKVDILIGTHRLLSKDVEFRRLGLVIVDEEHKFGVKHKDDLRRKRTEVDVLTLSATPIPRTLQMALSGARDVSFIRTAPAERLPIETEVAAFDERLVREAVLREISRGGQVFFVHNRVETMPQIMMRLQNILPEVRMTMAHAQLAGHQLEKIMLDFMHHKYDLLLSSMIIESGIDLPNVNTLIVNRADALGLAQLYQLRGRIGRSNRQAYAWMLTPGEAMVTSNARKRLRTLQEFNSLGGGYEIALRDLEIRGAGNILGKEQSGTITSVGYDLYLEMLEEAITALREGNDPETVVVAKEEAPIRIEIPGEALIPSSYIESIPEKVEFYRRLERMREIREVDELQSEWRDRFGRLPVAANRLLLAVKMRIEAKRTGVAKITVLPAEIRLEAKLPEDAKTLQHPEVAAWMLRFNRFFENKEAWVTSKPLGIAVSVRKGSDPDEAASKIVRELTGIQTI
ncbi:MAG: transcription-repair coupling factor [bacterium]|nr:transcription-repair coupling factor [bacterium]